MAEFRALVAGSDATPEQRIQNAQALHGGLAAALEARDPTRATDVLDELRQQVAAPEATDPERYEFVKSLYRLHEVVIRRDEEAAGALLAELRDLASREGASQEQRFVFTHALARAHDEVARNRDREGSEALVGELRTLVMQPDATEAMRGVLAQVLAGSVEMESGVLGDRDVAAARLKELRGLSRRPEANEAQLLSFARGLRSAYRAACRAGESATVRRPILQSLRTVCSGADVPGSRRRVLARTLAEGHEAARRVGKAKLAERVFEELQALASSKGATIGETLVAIEANVHVPWTEEWRSAKRHGPVLLKQIDAVARDTADDPKRRDRLMAALVRIHAHVRAAGDDAFGNQLLERLRPMLRGEQRTLRERLILGGALADGVWASGSLENRDLAEEMLGELDALVRNRPADERGRFALTRFLLKIQHRAAEVGDDHVSRSLLKDVWTLAGDDATSDAERSLIAHGFSEAHELALESGDVRLTGKLLDALRQLAARPGATPDDWRDLVSALEHSIQAEEEAGQAAAVDALQAEAARWQHRLDGV